VVHADAWDAAYVQELDRWLTSRGARSHGEFGGAIVYEITARDARQEAGSPRR
jgi:hypothetical protein